MAESGKSRQAMQAEFWNGEGGERWAAAQAQMDATLAPFADVILQAARIGPGDPIVDIGCGCGDTTLRAARLGARCVGIDISAPMLAVARRRAAEDALDAEFVQADAAVHHREGSSVATIISRFGTMFFDDPAAAFARFRTWLAPNGQLVATVWNDVQDNPWARELTELIRRHADVPSPPPDSPGPFAFADADALAALLRRAGFSSVQQRSLDIPMRVEGSREDAFRFYKERGPVTTALEAVGDSAIGDAIIAEIEALVDAHYDGAALSMGASARLVVAS